MTRRLPPATFDEALQAFLCISAWWGGYVPIRLASWGPHEVIWRQGPAQDLTGIVRFLDEEFTDEIHLGVPEMEPWSGGVGFASMLWAVVEGTDQLARARRFRPLPSLVLQAGSGTRRWLIWALEERVGYYELQDANRKLAYHLRATQRHGDADRAWFPAPGTCLREGRSRPVPVRVARLTTDAFRAESVVGRLKEPPAKDAWLESAGFRK